MNRKGEGDPTSFTLAPLRKSIGVSHERERRDRLHRGERRGGKLCMEEGVLCYSTLLLSLASLTPVIWVNPSIGISPADVNPSVLSLWVSVIIPFPQPT